MKRILLGAIVIATAVSHAQTPEARPQFEVASIKRNTDCGGRRGAGSPPSPGRMNMECITLRNLIQNAYLVFANGVGLNLKMVVGLRERCRSQSQNGGHRGRPGVDGVRHI
ncbi:exported hypothetical protein [Candidatus Sulfopaludibacter sp. SbA3]|nr:exported hypothetical protein [Candidatus Sulfopaludibacter sp. SbA3]